jgi:uncharacterized protein (TIGR03437 family)
MALAALSLIPEAWCQAPVISSVVNAASYQPTTGGPGHVVSVFGTNLATAPAAATSVPLPLQLAGTSVTVGGLPAPLFYVSPTQVNLQVPNARDSIIVVVSTPAGSSAPFDAFTATPGTWSSGGIFTIDSSGCGPGAALNVAADGGLSVNSTTNSAAAGDWISIFGTGLVLLVNPPIGLPLPAPPANGYPLGTSPGPGLEFDFSGLSAASPSWWGLAPGLVGEEQINVRIPASVREGCAVPLQAFYNTTAQAITPPVTLAIRQGGGQCLDPPAAGYGQITWQKTVTTVEPYTTSESDTITVSLQASPGKQAPPGPVYSDECPPPSHRCGRYLPTSTKLFGPSCAVPGYRSLDAGAVTVQGPSFSPAMVPSLPYQEGQLGGLSAYQAPLPNGAIRPGAYTVTAGGGAGVGAFQAALQIGADIQIQTALAGLVLNNCDSLTINWTGGDPNSWVTASLVQQAPAAYGGYEFVNVSSRTRTSNGTLTFQAPLVPEPGCGGPPPSPITIRIEVDPDLSEIAPFSAPGLSLGGQATWKYVQAFQASLEL